MQDWQAETRAPLRLHTLPFMAAMALVAVVGDSYVTKPKPRERPVNLSVITLACRRENTQWYAGANRFHQQILRWAPQLQGPRQLMTERKKTEAHSSETSARIAQKRGMHAQARDSNHPQRD